MNIRNRFRNWLKPDCPVALTQDEWREWHRNFRHKYPVRYRIDKWLTNITSFSHRLRHRWWKIKDTIKQSNTTVRTGLKSGYYDPCDIMLHTVMNMLVDYVEIDCARANIRSLLMDNDREALRIYRKDRWIPFYKFRSAHCGLAHLAWETTLDCNDLEPTERSESQAQVAREIIAIYSWWKNEYPNYDKIWDKAPERSRNNLFNLYFEASDDPEEEERYRKERENLKEFYVWVAEQEEAQKNKIEEMTLRLMRIRPCLWK